MLNNVRIMSLLAGAAMAAAFPAKAALVPLEHESLQDWARAPSDLTLQALAFAVAVPDQGDQVPGGRVAFTPTAAEGAAPGLVIVGVTVGASAPAADRLGASARTGRPTPISAASFAAADTPESARAAPGRDAERAPAATDPRADTAHAIQSSAGAISMTAMALLTDRTLPLRAPAPAAVTARSDPARLPSVPAAPESGAPALWLLGAALFGLVTITRRRVEVAPAAPLPAAAPLVAPLVAEPAREAVAPRSRSTTPTETDPATSSERLRPIPAPNPPCGGDLLPACPALAATAVPS